MGRYSGSSHGNMGGHESVAERTRINPVQIQSYLKGVSYPVNGRDLVTFAQRNGAPEDVIAMLRKLPEKEFSTPAEVTKALGDIW